MTKVQMFGLGTISLSSPRLKLMAQGMVQTINVQSQVWYHSAIQAPLRGSGLNERFLHLIAIGNYLV